MSKKIKADLLTYPLPFEKSKLRFGLKELIDSCFASGIDIIGIIGYTDRDDNPDERFERFYADKSSSEFFFSTYDYIAHKWSKEDDSLVAFSIINQKDKKITFIYGQNGPVVHNGVDIKLLRIGTKYHCRPGIGLEESVEEARENKAITIRGPSFFSRFSDEEKEAFKYFDAVSWDAQALFSLKNTNQEEAIKFAKKQGKPIVPVSNAHIPYFGIRLGGLSEVGRSYIEFDSFKWEYASELVEGLQEKIIKKDFTPHLEYSGFLSVGLWQSCMVARKVMKRTLGISCFDYTWPKKE